MYETFENLPESKKDNILQVCIEEFARNGYENTSTNTIVKRLGISKGVLFLYFKSKANLYLYIVKHLIKLLNDEFFERISFQDNGESLDIFDHLGEFYNILMEEKPFVLKFMLDAFLNPPLDLSELIEYEHNYAHIQVMERVNISNMREDVDPQMVLNLLHMISYHVGQMIFKDYCGNMDNFKENLSKYTETYKHYVKIIKYGVYKQKDAK